MLSSLVKPHLEVRCSKSCFFLLLHSIRKHISGSRYVGEANFQNANFLGEADFEKGHFCSFTAFDSAKFTGSGYFNCIFDTYVTFDNVLFISGNNIVFDMNRSTQRYLF